MESKEMEELRQLNPEIKEVIIGKKHLRVIQIYPLSMGDQVKFVSLVSSVIQDLVAKKDRSELEFAQCIVEAIKDNIAKILEFVTEEGAILLDEITNNQAVQIAEFVYEMNFESVQKKTKGLLTKVLKLFQLQKLSLESSEVIPNTESTISSESVLEMGD